MKVPPARTVIPLVVVIAVVAGSALAWWFVRSRPTLDRVADQIATGRFRLAEGQLRHYLQAYPEDELARLMLAKVLVERPEPAPKLAQKLLDGVRPTDPHLAALSKAIEGDAYFWERRYDRAEPAWLESLRLEPTIAEVGWKLLNIYAIQGRVDDSTRLALRLFKTEPDPHDRVQLLLQLLRHDAHPIEAGSVIHELEPIVRSNPQDMWSSLSLGAALIHSGRREEGLQLFRRLVQSHQDNPGVWSAYFDGLIETGAVEELTERLATIPATLTDSPQFELAKGWLADQRRDLTEAARAYRRALEARPSDSGLAYRYKLILQQAGKTTELAELSPWLDAVRRFPRDGQGLFDRINELPDLGLKSQPEILGEIAEALDRVGRRPEADAWKSLITTPPHKSP